MLDLSGRLRDLAHVRRLRGRRRDRGGDRCPPEWRWLARLQSASWVRSVRVPVSGCLPPPGWGPTTGVRRRPALERPTASRGSCCRRMPSRSSCLPPRPRRLQGSAPARFRGRWESRPESTFRSPPSRSDRVRRDRSSHWRSSESPVPRSPSRRPSERSARSASAPCDWPLPGPLPLLKLARGLIDRVRVRGSRRRLHGVRLGDRPFVARALVPDHDVRVQRVDLRRGRRRLGALRRRRALTRRLRLACSRSRAVLGLTRPLGEAVRVSGVGVCL